MNKNIIIKKLNLFYYYNKIKLMRHLLLIMFLLAPFLNIHSTTQKKEAAPVRVLTELMVDILNSEPNESRKVLKHNLILVCRNSETINDRRESIYFLNKLLKMKKFSTIHYFIYLQLAKLLKNSEKFYIKKALEVSGNDESRLETLIILYEYHKKKGEIDREILYLEKQAEVRKKIGDSRELKKIFITLGDYYMMDNNLIRSLQNFFEARKYSDRIPGARNGYIFKRIAKGFSLLGRNKLALKYLKKSHDCAIRFGADSLRMSVFNDYGKVYFSEGDYIKAAYYNGLSLSIAEKRDFPELKLNADFMKARICFNTEREMEGLSILKAAVDFAIRSESFSNLLPLLYEFIKRAVLYDNLEIASTYLKWLDEIYAPYYKGYFFYYFLKALIFEKRGNFDNARKYYEKASQNMEKFFSGLKNLKHYPFRREIVYIYSTIARFNFKMFDLTNDVRFLRKAIFAGEVKNPYMFRFVPGQTGQLFNFSLERSLIEKEIRIVQKKLESGAIKGREKIFYGNRINELRTQLIELDDLMTEVPRNYRRYRNSDLDIQRIQKGLAKDTVIIRFLVLEKNAYAFVIDSRSVGYKKLEKESSYIKKLTDSLMSPIEAFAEGSVDFLRIKYDLKKSRELFNIVLYEILEFQKDKKRLIIVPDNVLFRIPFEALVTGISTGRKPSNVIFSEYENAKYLIDDYSVEYILSLFHLKKRIKPRKRIFDIAAVGLPDIPSEGERGPNMIGIPYSGLEQLPSSGEEIENIKKIWGKRKNRYYIGEEFTKANFKQTAPLARIVHIATHFISNDEYPWNSFFLFSPGKGLDPLYYVSDISKLNFNCDLMFLSTCGSSENHLLGEQVINGMTAALYNSGVRSMIASLWPVNEFSARLIIPFYKGIRRDPGSLNDIAGLLRKEKIKFRKKRIHLTGRQKISFSHPLIWANFNLYRFY